LEENAVMAGEISGHYFFKEANYSDDVLVACLKILKIMKEKNKSLSELTKVFPKFFEESNIRHPVKEDKKIVFIENLKQQFEDKGYDIVTLDGVKVNFENGWMLFRPSNTEAKISFGYESSDREEFEKIKSIVEEIVKTIPQ
jgi:phosphomannomutase/phosphoglucomutase